MVVVVLGIGVAVLEVVPIGSNGGPSRDASGSSADGRTKESADPEEPATEPSSSTPVELGPDDLGKGVCVRVGESGSRLVYLEISGVTSGSENPRVEGVATGWESTPGK